MVSIEIKRSYNVNCLTNARLTENNANEKKMKRKKYKRLRDGGKRRRCQYFFALYTDLH